MSSALFRFQESVCRMILRLTLNKSHTGFRYPSVLLLKTNELLHCTVLHIVTSCQCEYRKRKTVSDLFSYNKPKSASRRTSVCCVTDHASFVLLLKTAGSQSETSAVAFCCKTGSRLFKTVLNTHAIDMKSYAHQLVLLLSSTTCTDSITTELKGRIFI